MTINSGVGSSLPENATRYLIDTQNAMWTLIFLAFAQADDILADHNVALPLDPMPDILIWNKQVVGPISDNPIEGMFWNIDQWGIKQ